MQQSLFTQPTEPRDPSRRKHKGNVNSVAAFEKVKPHITLLQAVVLDALHGRDMTPAEIAELKGHPLHAISGRCSELKAKGLVKPTGQRRNGGGVLTKINL